MNPWALIALVAAGFAGGWGVNGWRLDAAHQAEQNTRLEAMSKERDAAIFDRDKLAVKLATNNDIHTAQLRKLQNETNSLRDAVGAGAVRLRVAATCPQPVQTGDASGPAVDHGTRPELDPAARQDYFALKDGIEHITAQIGACQGELRLRTTEP